MSQDLLLSEKWQQTSPPPFRNNSSPLLRLPPEIRNRIWVAALGGSTFHFAHREIYLCTENKSSDKGNDEADGSNEELNDEDEESDESNDEAGGSNNESNRGFRNEHFHASDTVDPAIHRTGGRRRPGVSVVGKAPPPIHHWSDWSYAHRTCGIQRKQISQWLTPLIVCRQMYLETRLLPFVHNHFIIDKPPTTDVFRHLYREQSTSITHLTFAFSFPGPAAYTSPGALAFIRRQGNGSPMEPMTRYTTFIAELGPRKLHVQQRFSADESLEDGSPEYGSLTWAKNDFTLSDCSWDMEGLLLACVREDMNRVDEIRQALHAWLNFPPGSGSK